MDCRGRLAGGLARDSIDLREQRRVGAYALFSHVHIFRIEFDQDGVALVAIRDKAGGPGTPERVQHRAAFRTAGKDAGLDQGRWECGEVGFRCRLGRDSPDGADVATIDV